MSPIHVTWLERNSKLSVTQIRTYPFQREARGLERNKEATLQHKDKTPDKTDWLKIFEIAPYSPSEHELSVHERPQTM